MPKYDSRDFRTQIREKQVLDSRLWTYGIKEHLFPHKQMKTMKPITLSWIGQHDCLKKVLEICFAFLEEKKKLTDFH